MGDPVQVDALAAASVWAELGLVIVLPRQVLVHVSARRLDQLIRHTVVRLQIAVCGLYFEEIDATRLTHDRAGFGASQVFVW